MQKLLKEAQGKMNSKILVGLVIALTGASLFAEFKVPEEWTPKKIMDRDFWVIGFGVYFNGDKITEGMNYISTGGVYSPREKVSPGICRLAANPAFYDVANTYHCRKGYTKQNSEKVYSFLLPPISKDKSISSRPFFIRATAVVRTNLMRNPLHENTAAMSAGEITAMHNRERDKQAGLQYRRFFFGKFDHSNLRKFEEEHPNFVGYIGCTEWYNESFSWLFGSRLRGAEMFGAISPAEAEIIRKEWKPDNTSFEARSVRAKKIFDRGAEIIGDVKRISIFDGATCVGHLAADYGAGMIGCETSRTWRYWENQMICERGAARQFNLPWQWYIAIYGNGYTIDGKYTTEPYHAVKFPLAGSSHSLADRVSYYAWLSGTNFIQFEYILGWFNIPNDWEIGIQGQNYIRFYNFTKANPDRGTPYTPIALLRPALTPSTRDWKILRNTPGAGMDNAFRAAIYRIMPDEYIKSKVPGFKYERLDAFDPNPHDGVRKAGYEMSLGNTAPYGDIFDAITPDFKDQSSFKRIIPTYQAAILLGEYDKNPEMAKILAGYVKNGGLLVINTRQLNSDYPDWVKLTGKTVKSDAYLLDEVNFSKGQVVRRDADGNPLFIRIPYGKGNVIVTTPQYMIPDTDDWSKQAIDINTGKLKTPHVEALLKMVCAEFNPVKVEGDVKFGLNKTKNGWWLYLFNNKGVMKLSGKPEWLDMNRVAEVKIDFARIKVKSIKELRSGQTIPFKNNQLTLKVNPGDFKILELNQEDK